MSPDLNSAFTLKDCLSEGVKLAVNAYPDRYVFIVYGIGFDLQPEFSLPDGSVGKNVIILGLI